MIENAVKVIKQRQQAVNEQIQNLQAEAAKIKKALSALGKLSDVGTENAPSAKPPKAKNRKMSAAGRKAIAAGAKARWAKIRAEKKGEAAAAPTKAKTEKAPEAKSPQNKISLMDAVLKVLHPEKAQSIPEIITAVEKNGYVSNSKTFATIIGQTLRKAGEKVIRVRRGQYALNG